MHNQYRPIRVLTDRGWRLQNSCPTSPKHHRRQVVIRVEGRPQSRIPSPSASGTYTVTVAGTTGGQAIVVGDGEVTT